MIELRCKHRHTIYEHPSCFLVGNVSLPKEIENEKDYVKKTGNPWWTYPGYTIGYLDIETDGFYADSGNMLCWCIYDKRNKKVLSDVITQEDINEDSLNPDKRIVKSLIDAMRQFNIIVGYNSKFFDVPFARTRALACGYDFPSYGEVFHLDLYFHVKKNMKLSRSSLERACAVLGIDGKNHVDINLWRKARYGDPEALNYVLDHCKRDVKILSKLHDKLLAYGKYTKTSI